MIQLKVYKTPGDNTSAIFLDLYETEPIKLTLSIEDITNADATSVFSKTFRVPATRDNNEFFENAYAIDGIDFDVTVKNPAQILVDGAEFREGHIRLQKIYRNHDLDRIDYELLFLGETRDFSSAVGEQPMCNLTMTNFYWEDLPVTYTNANDFIGSADYAQVTSSWNAFPQTASLTAGYADGDILYPLIDHGDVYNSVTGNLAAGTVSVGLSSSFTQPGEQLATSRLKPMVRAKRIWDQIFQDAGYTYESNFLDSPRFKQMYASAFGNTERASIDQDQVTTGLFAYFNQTGNGNAVDQYQYFPTASQYSPDFIVGSPGSGGLSGGSSFIADDDASPSGAYYTFEVGTRINAEAYDPYSSSGYEYIDSRVELVVIRTGSGVGNTEVLAVGNWTTNNIWSFLSYDSRNGGPQPQAGDTFKVRIVTQNSYDIAEVGQGYWHCNSAPGAYYIPRDFNCETLQIDFIKDIITMFRLVMQPSNSRPNHFIIEPWSEFIGSGITYDWSDKLAEEKDMVFEPLFNTQSAQIEYTLTEDDDFINKFHQDNNKHPYGWLRFDSANELLKGKRDVKCKVIAPTPIDQINTGSNANHPYPQFILPQIIEVDGASFDRLPIVSKTRLLFYNGLQDISVSQDKWRLDDGSTNGAQQPFWPLVSPYENWPIINTPGDDTVTPPIPAISTLNLNFSNDTRYYIDPDPNNYNGAGQVIQPGYFDQGRTLFDDYWSRYVSSLYDKFSRRLTAKFILNNVDLQYLTFDDVIFVNGKYYRPEKIIDAQVGAETEVTVQLITLNDQRPLWLDEPLTGFSVAVSNANCVGEQGNIQITTNGTPGFTWELTNSGAQGTVVPTGTAPFTFTIDAPVGIDTLTVTDSLGRFATIQVDVPVSTSTLISSTSTKVDPTVCNTTPIATTIIVDYESTVAQPISSQNNYAIFNTKSIDLLESQVARPLPANGTGFNTYNLGHTFRLNTTTYPNLTTEWSGTITWTNLSFSTTNWSQYELGYSGPDGLTPSVVPSQFISGWPTSTPPIGTSFTVTVTNLPVQFGAAGVSPSPTMDFYVAKNGGTNSDWAGKWENTGTIIGKELTFATQCNGSITVTPSGGVGPYVITWSDSYVNSLSRTNLCPGQYSYFLTDSAGCQSDSFVVDLVCQTESYTYQLREHLNNCTQSSKATYIATSTTPLSINTTVSLNERAGCYYIQAEVSDTALYTIGTTYTDCADCNGTAPTPTSWKVQSCLQPVEQSPIDSSTRWISLTTPFNNLQPGDIVKDTTGPFDQYSPCYTVIAQDFVEPPNMVYSQVYQTCAECAVGFTYYAFACDTVSFPPRNFNSSTALNVGGVYKIQDGPNAGVCVEIIKEQTQTGIYDNLNSLEYTDCNDCQNITPPRIQVCHTIVNSSLGTATGVYEFEQNGIIGTYVWTCNSGQTIALCALVGSVNVDSGNVTITASNNVCFSPKQCRVPQPTFPLYVIEDCEDFLNWTMSTQGSSFSVGDVIQYQQGPFGGGTVYCGEIMNILLSGNPDAYLYNTFASYACNDILHCRT